MSQKLEELKEKRSQQQHKIYLIAIEIIFIFGIPAVVAVFVANWINESFSIDRTLALIVLLLLAFVSSWVILFARLKKVNKELTVINKQIREEEEGQPRKEILRPIEKN